MESIKGNLLDFPEGINCMFHQANTENIMGAGIAKQIKERYPDAYEADTNFYIPVGAGRLGVYTFARVDKEEQAERRIYNLYGQRLGANSVFGIPTDYFALRDALNLALHETINFFPIKGQMICGFPKFMSSGLGGGDWKIVEKIIEEMLDRYSVRGYIVEYEGW